MKQDDHKDLKRRKLRTAFLLLALVIVIFVLTVVNYE